MALFVGVDQALRKIGVSVLRDGEVALLELIVPPKDLRDTERLRYLEERFLHTLEPFDRIDGAAVEGQSYDSPGHLDQLGQILGIIKLALLKRYDVTPLVVPPASLKQFVTGRGQASKTRMMRATSTYWGLEITQDDLCDAHGLARFAAEWYNPQSRYRHQVEAVLSLKTPKKRKRIKPVFPKSL